MRRYAAMVALALVYYAFVSPRDGKVYRDWQSCHKATKLTDR